MVAGCFSRNEALNRQTGEIWNVGSERVYENWTSLLSTEKERVETIVVLTPTPHHTEVLDEVRSNGFSVICEKTLTTSVQSTTNLINPTKSRIHAIYNYTGYPMIREMRARITHGEIGDLLHCEVTMPQEGFLRRHDDGSVIKPQEWRQRDQKIPTVSLDLGIHVINLFRFVTNQSVDRLVASYQSRGNIPNIVDFVTVIAECSSDTRANFRFGKTSLGHSNGLSITCYGTRGSVSWVHNTPEFLQISDTFGASRTIHRGSNDCIIAHEVRYNRFKAGHPSGFIEAFSNHYFDIAEDLHAGKKFSDFTFDENDALTDMRILEAISDSVVHSQWIDLES